MCVYSAISCKILALFSKRFGKLRQAVMEEKDFRVHQITCVIEVVIDSSAHL